MLCASLWVFNASKVYVYLTNNDICSFLFLQDMFYDMLALNFVAMLDDISFRLAQLDILGKRLRNATTTACFRTEFERKPYAFRKKMTNLTKFIFMFNFLLLVACVTAIGIYQQSGHYQCHSLSVVFGDEIVSCISSSAIHFCCSLSANAPSFYLLSGEMLILHQVESVELSFIVSSMESTRRMALMMEDQFIVKCEKRIIN